jgi:hypothetical protein
MFKFKTNIIKINYNNFLEIKLIIIFNYNINMKIKIKYYNKYLIIKIKYLINKKNY